MSKGRNFEDCITCEEGIVDCSDSLIHEAGEQETHFWCENCGAKWNEVWEVQWVKTIIKKKGKVE